MLNEAISFYHPDDVGFVSSYVEAAIQRHEPFEYKLRIVRRNQEVVTVECMGVPIANEKGVVEGLIGVFRELLPTE